MSEYVGEEATGGNIFLVPAKLEIGYAPEQLSSREKAAIEQGKGA